MSEILRIIDSELPLAGTVEPDGPRLCACGRRIKSKVHTECSYCRSQTENRNAKDHRHRVQFGRGYRTPDFVLGRMEVYARRAELGLPLFDESERGDRWADA